MDDLVSQMEEIRLNVENANITPTKDAPIPRHKFPIQRANSMASTHTFNHRLGNFAKSLLEKAQSGNSDFNLSPMTIEALTKRPRPIQIPGCKNLLRDKKNIAAKENTVSNVDSTQAPVESKENDVQSTLDSSKSKTESFAFSSNTVSSPDRNFAIQATTLPLMRPTMTKVQDPVCEKAQTPDIQTRDTTSPLASPWKPRTLSMPIYEEDTTPKAETKIVTPVHTMMNPRMRTHPLLNNDEHSYELMVAYRQTNDAISSEIRPYLHGQPQNKQEPYTPQYRNIINMHTNSEVAARIPPMLPLAEQNSNVGPRMYLPNQMQIGVGTPVQLQNPLPRFRPPSSSGKAKIGPVSTKKPANSWKFRSETVDGKEYLRMKELGKGGCGTVDLVIEKEGRDLYALKKVNLAGMDDAIVQECINEIEMLMELRNTDLVIRIFSWEMNHVEKSMKIVMEYGQCDLNTSIKSVNCSLIRLKYIWERLLLIVETIHARGIVHADLKPANFVWVGDSLKIIDFGIANRLQSDHTSITTLNPKGTMNFISPETIHPDATGKTKISPKSDIWSLGCILYMMVYGKTPFQDITHYVAKINAISSGSVNYPKLSQELQYSGVLEVLQRCFLLDPKARPTAAELLKHAFLY